MTVGTLYAPLRYCAEPEHVSSESGADKGHLLRETAVSGGQEAQSGLCYRQREGERQLKDGQTVIAFTWLPCDLNNYNVGVQE